MSDCAVAVRDTAAGVVLDIHVQPGASCTGWVGLHGNALKYRVAAAPVAGAANIALCEYLARQFGIPKKSVTVLRGHTSRRKQVQLAGLTAGQVRAALEAGK